MTDCICILCASCIFYLGIACAAIARALLFLAMHHADRPCSHILSAVHFLVVSVMGPFGSCCPAITGVFFFLAMHKSDRMFSQCLSAMRFTAVSVMGPFGFCCPVVTFVFLFSLQCIFFTKRFVGHCKLCNILFDLIYMFCPPCVF